MTLVLGHFRRVGEFIAFPHRCPGEGCAIQRWILRSGEGDHAPALAEPSQSKPQQTQTDEATFSEEVG